MQICPDIRVLTERCLCHGFNELNEINVDDWFLLNSSVFAKSEIDVVEKGISDDVV
jgi:hypothetical protein